MDVHDPRVGAAEGGVERGVMEAVVVDFVEADRDLHRRRTALGVLSGQVGEELLGREGQFLHPALEEIAGQGCLGKHHQLRRLFPPGHLGEDGAESGQVLGIPALGGTELDDGEAEHA